MPYSLIIDVVVAVLLIVTISYAVRLNNRLSMMRRDRAELEKLAVAFAESTQRADESLGRLRSTADMLQGRIDSAQALHDDLAFLLNRGEKAADQLEELVRASRSYTGQNAAGEQTASAPSKAAIAPKIPREHADAPHAEKKHSAPPSWDEIKSEGQDSSERSDAERELLKALRSAK